MNKKIIKEYALQFVGLPYRWGGDDTINGFDCSGFVQEILMAFGKDPEGDQTAHNLYLWFRDRGDEKYEANIGDLVFFGETYWKMPDPVIKHVAIAIGHNLIIEAGGGGSNTTSEEMAQKQNAYIRIRPLKNRGDIVSIIDPLW